MAMAYIDESHRSGKYLISAVVTLESRQPQLRADLRRLILPGQQRVHFVNESDRRKKHILDVAAECSVKNEMWTATGFKQNAARIAIFEAMIPLLVRDGVDRFIVESGGAQDKKDRAVLAGTLRTHGLSAAYRHARPQEEPLLWLPDALAWCFGRNKQWRSELYRRGLVASHQRIRA